MTNKEIIDTIRTAQSEMADVLEDVLKRLLDDNRKMSAKMQTKEMVAYFDGKMDAYEVCLTMIREYKKS